jgi:hypothetical protein
MRQRHHQRPCCTKQPARRDTDTSIDRNTDVNTNTDADRNINVDTDVNTNTNADRNINVDTDTNLDVNGGQQPAGRQYRDAATGNAHATRRQRHSTTQHHDTGNRSTHAAGRTHRHTARVSADVDSPAPAAALTPAT